MVLIKIDWVGAVLAVVVLKERLSMTGKEVIEYIKKNLAAYNKPRYVKFAETLPRTATTEKIQNAQMRISYSKELGPK